MPRRRSHVPAGLTRLPEQSRHSNPQLPPVERASVVGNQAMCRLFAATRAQAKLEISQPNDRLEQEADRIASDVMTTMPPRSSSAATPGPATQGNLAPQTIEDHELLAKVDSKADGGASPQTAAGIAAASSGGEPLPAGLQSAMGHRLGADLGSVRTHKNAEADTLSRSVNARAFTTGNHIFFGGGEYDPSSSRGQELIAHELTHVVQQTGPDVVQRTIRTQDEIEKERNELAEERRKRRKQREEQGERRRKTPAPEPPSREPAPEPVPEPEEFAEPQDAADEDPELGIMASLMKVWSQAWESLSR